MSKEEQFSNLLDDRKLIELCNATRKSDQRTINKWYDKEKSNFIQPLKSGLDIDFSTILNASCILGIKLSKDNKVTTTQLRKLLTGFQIVKEETKNSEINATHISRLKLNLAYITARNSNITVLTDLLDSMLVKEKFSDKSQFDSVVTLLEGVIAYHKLAGGLK